MSVPMESPYATSYAFWVPLGGLGATYTVHLRLIEKLVVDFLFVLIEPFSLGVTANALQANPKSSFLKTGLDSFAQIFT